MTIAICWAFSSDSRRISELGEKNHAKDAGFLNGPQHSEMCRVPFFPPRSFGRRNRSTVQPREEEGRRAARVWNLRD
jgi:hypothetical protein